MKSLQHPPHPKAPAPFRQVRKLPMYGTTLFHVHNSKIFAAGHFFIAANSSGVQARAASNSYFGCSP